ncbi:MAG: NADH-quinone oxidoreductase subunit K [Candidatus Thorarchaeota archaeon]|nr:NADH-quinone oxidoreductase subunit K [Candidatus Thorarchaeota archaeon]
MLDMLDIYLIFALILYVLGIYTLASARNMIKLVIGIEILVAAANLNFLALGAFTSSASILGPVDPLVQDFVILSICIGGAVAAIAMSLIVNAYRHYGTLDVRELRRLKG